MYLTIEDFKKTASPEQIGLLDKILFLAKEEKRLVSLVNEYRKDADLERDFWGSSFVQIADLVVEQEIYLYARVAEDNLKETRSELSDLFTKAVKEYNLDHLGFFQRNYISIVGEPMPPIKS